MSASTITEAYERYSAEPSSGQTEPSATATLANGRARIAAGKFNFECDLPPQIGGNGQAPSPTLYLLGALAGCAVSFIANTLAPQFGVVLDDVSATAHCTSDLGGLLGVDGTKPALQDVAVDIMIATPSNAERVTALQEAWLARCPIYLSILNANRVTATFT